jgi:histidine phosphotransferase ChpT
VDVRVLELLASRICHDLISPVGAVNNGVEYLEEMGPDALEEALDLIRYSATQAAAKLQVFRYAYGAGGADSNIKPEDIQKAFSALISADGKITQSWDPYAPLGQSGNPPGFCKVLMGSLMLAHEFLPKGGNVSVHPGEPGQTLVSAESKDAVIRYGVGEALQGEVSSEDLDPKLVHPFAFSMLAGKYGLKVAIKDKKSADSITIEITKAG